MAIDSERVRRWLSDERVLAAILAVTAAGLVARLFALGHRVAQWDEGRVAYWTLRYEATGLWHYRPIVHGPFLFHVDARVFSLFGANDFTLRLVVAIVGGLLPLAAWLFRERLRDSETVALSLLLAFNPFLLYYSRFFRNDVLVATFMLLGVGLFVRAVDAGDHRYLYAAVAVVALGFTTKLSLRRGGRRRPGVHHEGERARLSALLVRRGRPVAGSPPPPGGPPVAGRIADRRVPGRRFSAPRRRR